MNYHYAQIQENRLKNKKVMEVQSCFLFQKKSEKTDKTQIISLGIKNFK